MTPDPNTVLIRALMKRETDRYDAEQKAMKDRARTGERGGEGWGYRQGPGSSQRILWIRKRHRGQDWAVSRMVSESEAYYFAGGYRKFYALTWRRMRQEMREALQK